MKPRGRLRNHTFAFGPLCNLHPPHLPASARHRNKTMTPWYPHADKPAAPYVAAPQQPKQSARRQALTLPLNFDTHFCQCLLLAETSPLPVASSLPRLFGNLNVIRQIFAPRGFFDLHDLPQQHHGRICRNLHGQHDLTDHVPFLGLWPGLSKQQNNSYVSTRSRLGKIRKWNILAFIGIESLLLVSLFLVIHRLHPPFRRVIKNAASLGAAMTRISTRY